MNNIRIPAGLHIIDAPQTPKQLGRFIYEEQFHPNCKPVFFVSWTNHTAHKNKSSYNLYKLGGSTKKNEKKSVYVMFVKNPE